MRSFVHDLAGPRVVFGAGALDRVPAEVERLGARRVALVAGARGGSHGPGAADRVVAALGDRLVTRISEVVMHVPVEVAERAVAQVRGAGADLVVTLGGGSATGLGKAVALRTGLPVLAVPTTFAGSEVTPVWGLTQAGRKTTGRDPRVLPRVVVYDPELLRTLPPGLAAASGMNALAHCLEALYAPDASPLVPPLAEEGLRVLARSLPLLAADPGDGDRGSDALYGAWLAGTVLAAAPTGVHHTLAHVLGGSYDLPHAGVHAALLPQVAAWNLPAAPEAAERAARALGDDPATVLRDLAVATGAPTSLAALGWDATGVDDVVAAVLAAPPANPRPVEAPWLRELLLAALHGDPPTGAPARPPEPAAAAGPAAELTAEVLGRLDAAPDPRLREVLQAAVRHLHGFATEVRLTPSEWVAGIGFLTEVGHLSDDRRQEFILLSDTLGLSSLVETLAHEQPDGATESTILGPFYRPDAPWRELGDSIAVDDPGGVPALVRGRVRSTDGEPLAGAVLDVWQTASNGRYDVQDPDQPPGNMRGRFRAAADGSFTFRTSRPVSYPIPDDGPVGRLLRASGRHPWRAAHIHVIVTAEGHEPVTTHLFDAENPYLDSDTVFGVRAGLVDRFRPGADGTMLVEHDFVLRRTDRSAD